MTGRITVNVLLFAAARDATRLEQTSLELPVAATGAGLLDLLCRRFPALDSHRPTLRLAVNEEYVGLDEALHDGDEVAVIPPVCGG